MLTVDALKELGANTEEGLARCMNNESFYLKMVGMGLNDAGFGKLEDAVRRQDFKAAFEEAHALKGIMMNLSLTSISRPVSELTDLLRPQQPVECGALLDEIKEQHAKYKALLD